MGLSLITAASDPAVGIEQVRAYCGVEDDSRDTLLAQLSGAATARVQNLTGRSLAVEGWRLTLDAFSDAIELARGPVVTVSAVNYYDADGVQQLLDPSVYTLDLVSTPQWVVLNSGETWPELLDAVNAVSIDFTAGYTQSSLPGDLGLAVLMLTAQWFQQRVPGEVPKEVLALVGPYRRIVI